MRLLALSIAVTAVAGCTQSPVVPKIEESPITLSIAVSDSVLVLGGRDTIRVTVTNTLDRVIRITFPTQCQVKVFIRNSSSTVVLPPSGDYTCSPVTSQLSLVANGTSVFPFVWTGGRTFLPPDPTEKLPYGVYYVTALLETDGLYSLAFPVRIRFAQTR